MAAQHSQGIQTLLEAEKDAARVVQDARQYRTQRLKDARTQAEKEIEEYRKQKEREFKTYESEHAGATQVSQSTTDKETDAILAKIESSYKQNQEPVVQKLLDRVILVKPELHRNLKKEGS